MGTSRTAAYNLPCPDAEEFAPIRGELARLYIRHKTELKMADWSDERIAAQVGDITAALVSRATVDDAWQ